MKVVDAHAHLWNPQTTPRAVTPLVRALGWSPRLLDWMARRVFPRDAMSFFASPEHITRRYELNEYNDDTASHEVVGLVHIEAGWNEGKRRSAVDETRWLQRLTPRGAGRVLAIVAKADLGSGTAVLDLLRAHVEASERVRGVREMAIWHPNPSVLNGARAPGLLENARWREGFEQLGKLALSFDATVYDSQLGELADLASAYPKQPIALCHMGIPVGVGGPYCGIGTTASARASILARWQESMHRLAECPNVHVKLSGLGMPVCGFGWERRAVPPKVTELCAALNPLVDFAINTFGAERCMFASNFPVDKVSVPFATLLDAMLQMTAERSANEREWIFNGVATRFYRLQGSFR